MVKIVDRYYLVTVIYSHKLKCCCFKMIFYFSFDIENGSTVIFDLILIYHYIWKFSFKGMFKYLRIPVQTAYVFSYTAFWASRLSRTDSGLCLDGPKTNRSVLHLGFGLKVSSTIKGYKTVEWEYVMPAFNWLRMYQFIHFLCSHHHCIILSSPWGKKK